MLTVASIQLSPCVAVRAVLGGAREALAHAGPFKPVQKSLHVYLCPKLFVQPSWRQVVVVPARACIV